MFGFVECSLFSYVKSIEKILKFKFCCCFIRYKESVKNQSIPYFSFCWLDLLLFFRKIVLCRTDISKGNRVVWFDSLMSHFRAKTLMKCCFKKIKKWETNEPCTIHNCSRKVKEVSKNSVLQVKPNIGSFLCKRPSLRN